VASDEEVVRRLERAWNEAYLSNDRSAFAEILADDFRGFLPDGRSIAKAELMAPTEPRRVEFSELSLHLFGPTALSRGRVRVEHPEGAAEQRFVRIYSKRKGRWQAVAVQVFPCGEGLAALRVERAQADDAAAVYALFEESAEWLGARGIRQWLPGALPAPVVTAGIARGEVFVVRGARGGLDATLQLQDADPDVWGPDDGSALYLHRLCVARARAGAGLGARLLAWALGETAARGRARLRLDCVASNGFLRAYYTKAGFAERGEARLGDFVLTRFERAVPRRP